MIANNNNIDIITRCDFPSIECDMTFEECNDELHIHNLFMSIITENKNNVISLVSDKTIEIIDNEAVDFGGVWSEALNKFSSNFMQNLYNAYSEVMIFDDELFYSFNNAATNQIREEAFEIFTLGCRIKK